MTRRPSALPPVYTRDLSRYPTPHILDDIRDAFECCYVHAMVSLGEQVIAAFNRNPSSGRKYSTCRVVTVHRSPRREAFRDDRVQFGGRYERVDVDVYSLVGEDDALECNLELDGEQHSSMQINFLSDIIDIAVTIISEIIFRCVATPLFICWLIAVTVLFMVVGTIDVSCRFFGFHSDVRNIARECKICGFWWCRRIWCWEGAIKLGYRDKEWIRTRHTVEVNQGLPVLNEHHYRSRIGAVGGPGGGGGGACGGGGGGCGGGGGGCGGGC